MKVHISELKKYLPNLNLSSEQLAIKLSLIGHESEAEDENTLDVKLTSNRKDCQDLKYLAFDIAALYPELGASHDILLTKPSKKIMVTLEKVNKILGSSVSQEQYRQLERLGFNVSEKYVSVPEFRTDIFESADIAEEVFRLIGANGINIEMLSKEPVKPSPLFDQLNNIRFALSAVGATETRTISFSDRGVIELVNPFSKERPYLQPDLTDGLLETLAKNPFSRRNIFFEIADVFTPEESTHLGIVISGYKKPDDLITRLTKAVGSNLSFTSIEQSHLDKFSVKQPNVHIAEVDVSSLRPSSAPPIGNTVRYKKISEYPPLVRDVTTTEKVEQSKLYDDFPELHLVELVDTYSDAQTGRVTDTYRLIFQNHKGSFTSEDIAEIDERIERRFFAKS